MHTATAATSLRVAAAVLGIGLAVVALPAAGAEHTTGRTAAAAPAAVRVLPETLVGTRHDLGTLGGERSEVTDVDGQVVVGSSERKVVNSTHAYAYDFGDPNPHMVDLGHLRGGDFSTAEAVDGPIVVGRAEVTGFGDHAFAYDLSAARPHMIDLGALTGGGDSEAFAVDHGVVVGVASTDDDSFHAFAYDLNAADPHMVDLGVLDPSVDGPDSEATDVSNGVVVGNSPAGDQEHAFAYNFRAPHPAMRDLGAMRPRDDNQAVAVDQRLVAGVAMGPPHFQRERGFTYDLAAASPTIRPTGDLDGGKGSTSLTSVDDGVVAGQVGRPFPNRGFWAMVEDVRAESPAIRILGSLGGHADLATDIEGSLVAGWATRPLDRGRSRAFAFDLAAAHPRMVDLGQIDGDFAGVRAGRRLVAGTLTVKSARSDPDFPTFRAFAWTLATTTAPAVRFAAKNTRVSENAGKVRLTLVRDGNPDVTASVHYATSSRSAVAGRDFRRVSGTLRFAPGQTTATLVVPIINDHRREHRERFRVDLSHPTDGTVPGTPRAAGVIIRASDQR